MKFIIKLVILILFCIFNISEVHAKSIYKGIVQEVLSDNITTLEDGEKQREQLIKIKLNNHKIIETINIIPTQLSYQVILQKGDKIILREDEYNTFYIEGFDRSFIIYFLLILFSILLIFFGGKKGILALISIILKGSLLLFITIPLIEKGYSPIIITTIFAIIATILTISLVSGFNYKTASACIGSIGGVIIAGILGAFAVKSAHLSGLLEPEMETLHYQFPLLKIKQILSAGIIIGSLGATMDVSISIASSLWEVHLADIKKSFFELYNIGLNIGQDIMGTMVNTLILAYAGGSLATIILLLQIDTNYLIHMELFVKEIILSIVGSIGLILSIPLTSLCSSYFYTITKSHYE